MSLPRRARAARTGAQPWIAAPAALATVAVAGVLAWALRGHAARIAVVAGVAALVAPILWVIASALRPALPDRRCPRCGAVALVLLRRDDPIGVRCRACAFEDPETYVAYLKDVMDDPEVSGPPTADGTRS